MASSLRSHWDRDDMGGDPASDGDPGSYTEGSSVSSSDGYESELELESMTGKGIKRLCSELLELKKASDEDFQRNVCSNLSTFVRIFEEVGGVEIELMTLKQHVLTQKKLVQDLASNIYSEMIVSLDTQDIEAEEPEDLDPSSPNRPGSHRYNALETLDVLLFENQIDKALIVLETETENLRKLRAKEELLSPTIVFYMSALSDRRARIAERYASMAAHPRVAQPELQKALSGLCRLGDSNQANVLLLRFYHSRLESHMHELQHSMPRTHGTYITELAKVVFSAISQAARSFVMLYGETSPYTSELIKWARDEIEAFSCSFDNYVKSTKEIHGGLSLAVEAAKSALSFCVLLKSQKMVLQPYLTKFIRPCMEEMLQMHINHSKKVVDFFVGSDTWVLSKFPISGILRGNSSFTGIDGEVEYCLLTGSGRKFVTLMQAIMDDITPLVTLQMESSILKGLTDLFNVYMHVLEKAIPNRGNIVENDLLRISSAQQLQQQISLLVNSSTLVYFFPSIAGNIFKLVKPSNHEMLPEQTELSSQNELDSWMLSILEAADRLRGCFCEQFVHQVMSRGESYLKTSLESDVAGQCILGSSEVPVPSFAFQALFLRLRELELSKSVFAGEDGIVKMLLIELMETVIIWLSNNQDFWEKTESCSVPHPNFLEQVYIDMHFLLEIAKLGGYFSDDLMDAALDLIAQIRATFTAIEFESNSSVPDDEWASKAAKLAIEKLLEVEVSKSDRKEPAASFGEHLSTQKLEDVSPSDWEDTIHASEDYTGSSDGESAGSIEEDIRKLHEIGNIHSESLEVNIKISHFDEEGLRCPTIHVVSTEVAEGRESDTSNGMTSEIVTKEPRIEGPTIVPDVESVGKLVELVTGAGQFEIDKLQDTVEAETLPVEAEFLDICNKPDAAVAYSDDLEVATLVYESKFSEILGMLDATMTYSNHSERATGHSDDEGLRGPTIHIISMEDGHDAVGSDIDSDVISEIEGTEESDIEGPAIVPEVVSGCDSDNEGWRRPTIHIVSLEDERDASGSDMDSDMISEIEGTDESDMEKPIVIPEEESTGNLVVSVTGAADFLIDQLQDRTETETLAVEAKFFEISDQLDVAEPSELATLAVETKSFEIPGKRDAIIAYPNNSNGITMSVEAELPDIYEKLGAAVAYPNKLQGTAMSLDNLDGHPSISHLEGMGFDLKDKPSMLLTGEVSDSTDKGDGSSRTVLEELVQDDSYRVAEHITVYNASGFEKEQSYSLPLEESCEEQGGGGATHVGDGINYSADIEDRPVMLQTGYMSDSTDKADNTYRTVLKELVQDDSPRVFEEMTADSKNNTVMLQSVNTTDSIDKGSGSSHTVFEELVQDDSPRVSEGMTTDEATSFEEESGNSPDLRKSNKKQEGVGANCLRCTRKTSRGVLWSKGGHKRPKSVDAAEGAEKNRKGSRATRPKWH